MGYGKKTLLAALAVAVAGVALHWRAPAASSQGKDDDALIKRGAYLANEVARCGDCHTPRDKKGRLDMSRNMQGAKVWLKPVSKTDEWADSAPDITSSGRGGKWTEDKWVKYLTSGEQSDPPMPAYRLSKEDARAIAAYLRSLPGRTKGDAKERDRH